MSILVNNKLKQIIGSIKNGQDQTLWYFIYQMCFKKRWYDRGSVEFHPGLSLNSFQRPASLTSFVHNLGTDT